MAINTLYSMVNYIGDGTTTSFIVPFPYLYVNDVHLSVDDEEVDVYPVISQDEPPAGYDAYWYSSNTLRFTIAPADGAEIIIQRETNKEEPEVEFENSAILTEEDLNLIATQLLYIVQEAYDNFSISYNTVIAEITSISNATKGYRDTAKSYKDDAKSYMDSAKDYRDNAADSASTAAGSALSASNSAGTATSKASEANNSALSAAASAAQAATIANNSMITATGSTTARSLANRFADIINVKDFGAKGDGVTDDTDAIKDALTLGKDLFFPAGQYIVSDTLTIPDGVGVWGQGQGYDRKHPTALLFTGTGVKGSTVAGTTSSSFSNPDADTAYLADSDTRGDTYKTLDLTQSFSVGVILGKRSALHYIGVILNADYEDTATTSLGADWDVGVWCKDADEWCLDHVSAVGYWRKAGCLVTATTSCEHGNAYRCNFSGFRGVAIRSADTAPVDNSNWGLAGTQFIDCDITSVNLASCHLATSSFLTSPFDSPSGCLEISGGVMRGIQFFGCTFLSRDDIMWIMPKCQEIFFFGCYTEGKDAKVSGSWLGTVGTRIITTTDASVMLFGCTKYGVDWSPRYARESNVTRYTATSGVNNGYIRDDEYENIRFSGSISHRLMQNGSYKWYDYDYDQIASISNAGNLNLAGGVSIGGTDILTSATSLNILRNTSNYIIRTYGSGNIEIYGGYASFEGTVRPKTDNSVYCGTSSQRWKEIFAAAGTINTSDERTKTSITDADEDEALMQAWSKVRVKVFKFKDAVAEKGEQARWHTGLVAQQIVDAFESEGLDASRYGLLCYDEWDDEYEDVEVVDVPAQYDEEGTMTVPAQTHFEHTLMRKAGNSYGVRYAEALALECAYQRWRLDRLEAMMTK